MMKTIAKAFLWFILIFQSVEAQRNGDFFFVKVSEQPVNIDTQTEKVYTTTIRITHSNNTSFNETIFLEATNSFYSTGTPLQGFLNLSLMSDMVLNDTTSSVTYKVNYNYLQLNSSANGSDAEIEATIGNVTFVKSGIESNAAFSSVYDIIPPFLFAGNSICGSGGCNPGTYVTCTETTGGVSITCASVCRSNYCLNDGWCIHDDPNTSPLCSCRTSYDSWYVGPHCEALLQLWMPILFFVVVFLIIFAVIPMGTCFCIRSMRNKKPKEETREEIKTKPVSFVNGSITTPDIKISNEVSNAKNENHYTSNAPIPAPRSGADVPHADTQTDASFHSSSSFEDEPSSPRASERHETETDQQSNRQGSSMRDGETTSEESVSSNDSSEDSDASHDVPATSVPIPYNSPPVYSTVNKTIAQPQAPLISTV